MTSAETYEVAQRQHPQEVPPRRVPAPVLARTVTPRDDHERAGRQTGQERLAQPPLQGGCGLEGVEQEHRALPVLERTSGHAHELREECRRRRLDRPEVEPDRRAAARLGRLGERGQQ